MALTSEQRTKLLERIEPVSDFERSFKLVLYGPPDVGKTVCACELGNKNFMLHSEPGFTVLTKPEHKHLGDRTEKARFTSLKGMDGYVELIEDGSVEADTFIVDNMSGVQDKVLAANHKTASVQKLSRAHPDLSVLGDYQIVTHQMRDPIINLMEMSANMIMICHMRPADPERGEFQIRPDLTRKIFELVNEKADVVAYMHKDAKGQRKIQTVSTDRVIAKSRITEEAIMPVSEFISQMNNWRPNL